ncbi:ribosomal L18p/L5e family protein [Actinidia rufa]|uniref:Ribosomal L18p/L5e family protein n=1 Tax=Actinidia rufa TaxID=165716 RepID=A0A7J0HBR8_9ERIC|nr:ribosomal L18p/L5e family protein [Actinidia rufa]
MDKSLQATASTVEECGRSCNARRQLLWGRFWQCNSRWRGLEQGQGRGIRVDVNKEVEKKGLKNRTKVWAIVNALKSNGVKLMLDDDDDNGASRPSFKYPPTGRTQGGQQRLCCP